MDDGAGLLLHVGLPRGGEAAEAVLYWPRYPDADGRTDWTLVPAP